MIFCVEDDNAIRDLMVYTLNASGFEAKGFENDEEFWSAIKKQVPELVILDVMLPGEDGMLSTVCCIKSSSKTLNG